MKLVTYNVFHCAIPETKKIDYDFYANTIKKHNPDFCFLQEVRNGGPDTNNVNQAKKLSNMTGMEYWVFGKALNRTDGGEYGNAILSKYPLSSVKLTSLPARSTEDRCMVSAQVTYAGKKFRIGATHLALTSTARKLMIEKIKGVVESSTEPYFLLGGDFNCTQSSSGGALIDTFMNYFTSVSQIDNICYKGSILSATAKKVDDGNGDHDPVVGWCTYA